jgi:thiamine transporter
MKNKKLQTLCVCAMMVALSTALSFIKIWNMPWGGSITLLSMLPVALVSIMYGLKEGLFTSFVYACIQLVFGITMDGLFAWGLTAGMLTACIILDYIAAFTVIGFAGIFRNKGIAGIMGGTIFAVLLRFVCHLLSGVFVFASAGKLWEGFETSNTWLYSFVYNACYMLPEIILTAIGAFFVYKALEKTGIKN